MKLKPYYLILHFSPWQMSNGKLSHHVEKRPEIILSAHFLVGNNKPKILCITQFKTNTPGEGVVVGGTPIYRYKFSNMMCYLLPKCFLFLFNTLKDTAKAPAVGVLSWNTLRDTITVF